MRILCFSCPWIGILQPWKNGDFSSFLWFILWFICIHNLIFLLYKFIFCIHICNLHLRLLLTEAVFYVCNNTSYFWFMWMFECVNAYLFFCFSVYYFTDNQINSLIYACENIIYADWFFWFLSIFVLCLLHEFITLMEPIYCANLLFLCCNLYCGSRQWSAFIKVNRPTCMRQSHKSQSLIVWFCKSHFLIYFCCLVLFYSLSL